MAATPRDKWGDKATSVREGEEVDSEALRDYLLTQFPQLTGDLTLKQFPNGFSNLTYLLQLDGTEFVLRRPPFGANIKSAHDMSREYHILSHLKTVYPKIPNPYLYCDDPAVIGAPFYLMERLNGVIIRPQMPPEMVPNPELMNAIAASFIENLTEIHALDYQEAGLGDFGNPVGYVQRQVTGWQKRYLRSKTDEIRDMDQTAVWLAENIPTESDPTLIHNDYKHDNLVLNPSDWTKIIGVLDWEMATIGDPLMDLGTTLAYWVQPDDPPELLKMEFSPTSLPGNPTRDEVVQLYALKSGKNINNLRFYYVYGLFKLAVIVQQIYSRYKQGFTKDPRFTNLIFAVKACAGMAQITIHNTH